MKHLVQILYRFKIRVLFYFGLGYSEVSNFVSLAKDIAIILGFLALVLHWHIGLAATLGLGLGSFALFTLLGLVLKKSGMSDYAVKTSNSVNPELQLVRKIAKHLNINE
jgi:hypothetical protein